MTPGSREENADSIKNIVKKTEVGQLQLAYDQLYHRAEKLEQDNQKLKDAVNEERFVWITSLIIVFDALIFPSMNGWGLVAILALEMILVLVLARRLGIEDVASFMEKIMASFAGFVKNKAKRP